MRRLLGEDDGPPKVTLPAPRREPKADRALERLLPADPRPTTTVEERGDYCPSEREIDGRTRRCGRPRPPGEATCRRPQCKAWATRKAAEERPRGRAKVLTMTKGRG